MAHIHIPAFSFSSSPQSSPTKVKSQNCLSFPWEEPMACTVYSAVPGCCPEEWRLSGASSPRDHLKNAARSSTHKAVPNPNIPALCLLMPSEPLLKRAVLTQVYCSLQNSLVYCSLQMRLINLVLPSTLRSTSSVMVLVFILITLRGIRPWVLLAWATEACTSKRSMWVDLWQLIASSFAHLLDHHTWF